MAAADVDIGYLGAHLGLDQPVLTSLINEPTADLVVQVLQAIAAKAHEYDELYAAKLQTDIELESAVRGSESRSQASKETTEKALKDLEETRQKLKDEGMLRRPANAYLLSLDLVVLTHNLQRRSGKPSRMNFRLSRPRARGTMTISKPSTTRSRPFSRRIARILASSRLIINATRPSPRS
jgi:hypothetical protein